MDRFAFIIHPLNPKADVARKYPGLARVLPIGLIHFLSRYWPPLVLSHVTGIRSESTGKEIEGWLLACPLTARQLLRLPERVSYWKIIQTGRLAQRLRVDILGLGAYTSVVGDGGVTVARALEIPVTTGDSYTVALTVRALLKAGAAVGVAPREATAAVVGATGAIGSACARLLATRVRRIILEGRRMHRLHQVAGQVRRSGGAQVDVSADINSIREAHLVISATSAGQPIIEPEHLRPGAVVCDVAQPHDVSRTVVETRDDVLVVDGGIVALPGDVDFGFDYGLPPGLTFGCMAETIALALEGHFADYTLGKNLELERVQRIERMADRHGLRLATFRSFGRALEDETIEAVRRRAGQAAGADPV
ncbi:MAG: shikimate dehydrogenase [Anaerolineae bacterium]|jgi:predicted amino acid dehydrogenase